jgi:multicomponent K+:H+ antiporter subunit F
MLSSALDAGLVLMVITLALNFWGLVRGPEQVDRLLALDTLNVNAVALLIIVGIRHGTKVYYEAAVVIAMLGFVATVALCRYLLRRRILE